MLECVFEHLRTWDLQLMGMVPCRPESVAHDGTPEKMMLLQWFYARMMVPISKAMVYQFWVNVWG